MKKHIFPLLAVLCSAALSMALIHFWLAAFLSSIIDMSYSVIYWYLTTLLIVLTVSRIVATLRHNDVLAKAIDRWLNTKGL